MDLEMTLAARSVVYGLLHRVCSEAPDEGFFELESSEIVTDSLAIIDETYGGCVPGGVPWTPPAADEAFKAEGRTLEGEYNRLFVGVGRPAVNTWESHYETGSSALFQKRTLEVRRFYESCGLRSRDYPRTADDHVAIELAFMREMALRSLSEKDGRLRLRGFADQAEFLRNHLGGWIARFSERVASADESGYYASYAALARDFVMGDLKFLEGMLNS